MYQFFFSINQGRIDTFIIHCSHLESYNISTINKIDLLYCFIKSNFLEPDY